MWGEAVRGGMERNQQQKQKQRKEKKNKKQKKKVWARTLFDTHTAAAD